MSLELKVKAKSLAEEARIIRKEEQKLKAKGPVYNGPGSKFYNLQSHRKGIVRHEARHTHVARAYLWGRPYSSVEKRPNPYLTEWDIFCGGLKPERIAAMVSKYGPKKVDAKQITAWILGD